MDTGSPVATMSAVNNDMSRRIIEKLRRKLLDLTTRNPLLAFRHSPKSKRFVRVVDELPDELFRKLEEGTSLRFKPVPDPPDEPADERSARFRRALEQAKIDDPEFQEKLQGLGEDPSDKAVQRLELELRSRVRARLGLGERPGLARTTAAEVAQQHNIDPAFDLPMPEPDGTAANKHTDNAIQTLRFRDDLDRVLAAIRDQWRLSLEEAGVNTLYCAFGFLEWYDAPSSEIALHAPLLLYPLEIERTLVRGQYVYSVKSIGEDPEVNITLLEKLRHDFGLELPSLEEGDTPESYLLKVTDVIHDRASWKVRRWITVGLFSFARIAMYKDLDPAAWPKDSRLEANARVAKLLVGVDQEVKESAAFAVDREIEGKPEHVGRPPLIADADTSQVSVVLDVLDGKDLVVEGPPGTGKSQTITNVIAAMLAAGKTVLFIAEKMAALNVVKSRLADAGLGEFCLELHSTKARRRDAVAALGRRLRLSPMPWRAERIDTAITEAESLRSQLAAYVAALNRPVGTLERTPQELLWTCQRQRDEHPHVPPGVDEIAVPRAEKISGVELESICDVLATFARHREPLLAQYGSKSKHPWYGVAHRDMDPFKAEDTVRRIRALHSCLQDVELAAADVDDLCSWPGDHTLKELTDMAAAAAAISPPEQGTPAELLGKLAESRDRVCVERLLNRLTEQASLGERIESEGGPLKQDCSPRLLSEIASSASALDAEEMSVSELSIHAAETEKQVHHLTGLVICAKRLAAAFELGNDLPARILRPALAAARAAAEAPPAVIAGREPGLLRRDTPEVARRAIRDAKRLREERDALRARLRIDELGMEPDALIDHANAIRDRPLVPFFSARFRRALSAYRMISLIDAKSRADDIARDFQRLATYLRETRAFTSDRAYQETFGRFFRGIDTDFAPAAAVADWAVRVREKVPAAKNGCPCPRATILESAPERFEAIRRLVAEPQFAELERCCGEVPDDYDASVAEVSARERAKSMRALEGLVASSGLESAVRLSHCLKLSELLSRRNRLAQDLDGDSEARGLIGDGYAGRATDPQPIERGLRYARCVTDSAIPKPFVIWLLQREQESRQAGLSQSVAKLQGILTSLSVALAELDSITDSTPIAWSDWVGPGQLRETGISTLSAAISRALACPDGLNDLVLDQRAEHAVHERGLGPLLKCFERAGSPLSELPAGYYRALCYTVVRAAVGREPALAKFSGLGHQGVRERYAKLDRDLKDLHQKKIANDLLHRNVDPGNSFGPRKAWTGRALLQLQTGLKRPSASVRDLLDRAGVAAQQLAPCFMMSPLSVAQYLRPGSLKFDVVIMDEASQLRPEDALGAVARGGQVVIVGDPKQLPPTDFFRPDDQPTDDDELDDASVAEEDSILEVAMSIVRPPRRLKWHYRSRHGSLIAFSNERFYDHDLIIFPSPHHEHPELGVKYVPVSGSAYRAGLNPPEAQQVARAAVDFMRDHPNLSLGVVTLNSAQRELLALEVDRLIVDTPGADEYVRKWESTLEPFFVKNLENVQGDERDVIFISTVYGRGEDGAPMAQRFGPINRKETGHRRLNVLFTRAKRKTVVFSCIDPGDIRIDETSSLGVQALQGYLHYAKTGILDQAKPTSREPDSDFEISVARLLREQGYEAEPQVGVAGYFIDIGVRHPKRPGTFALGIECDGAMYHSAKSTRDRDRLRQEVLEKLGWTIHRIWSLDWYRNRDRELNRLLTTLQSAISRSGD